jgi:uncharacterized membrane protein YeaQ/YmgE (transglycosylase-associated protein family)
MENIITWLIVGLVAGVMATAVLRGPGFGWIGDIVLGIVGSFVGSYAFRELKWKAPLDGLAGVILVAFCGAVIVLLGLRLVQGARARR